MFAKLFFVRDAKTMINIVIEGLYPAHYLDSKDEKGNEGTNRQRLEKVSKLVLVFLREQKYLILNFL
jgi:hypothetical protein